MNLLFSTFSHSQTSGLFPCFQSREIQIEFRMPHSMIYVGWFKGTIAFKLWPCLTWRCYCSTINLLGKIWNNDKNVILIWWFVPFPEFWDAVGQFYDPLVELAIQIANLSSCLPNNEKYWATSHTTFNPQDFVVGTERGHHWLPFIGQCPLGLGNMLMLD